MNDKEFLDNLGRNRDGEINGANIDSVLHVMGYDVGRVLMSALAEAPQEIRDQVLSELEKNELRASGGIERSEQLRGFEESVHNGLTTGMLIGFKDTSPLPYMKSASDE